VIDFFTEGNLGPFPKENFYLAVEKFVISKLVMYPFCLLLKIEDILSL